MRTRRSRTVLGLSTAGLLLSAVMAVPSQAALPQPRVLRATPQPTMQTNGTVVAMASAAGKVFVAGGFTAVRPDGAPAGDPSEVPQAYLAAYDAATGVWDSSFRPVLTNTYNGAPGVVRALDVSPDGSTLYVGGDFNTVSGVKAEHVAAFDTRTGALQPAFGSNGVNGNVSAVEATAGAVFVGGTFTKSTYRVRTRLAAFSPTGAVLPWAPTATESLSTGRAASVDAIETSPDGATVYVGGTFDKVNGVAAHGLAAVDAAGQLVPGFAVNVPPASYVTDLATDGQQLYMTGRDDRTPTFDKFEGVKALSLATGATHWYAQCYGDSFGALPLGGVVYVATHAHNCTAIGGWPESSPRHYASMYAVDARDGELLPFSPMMTGSSTVPGSLDNTRALATDGRQLFVGGGWMKVEGRAQANLVRFSPDGVGAVPGKPFATATTDSTGAVVLRWRTVADSDDRSLTYRVYRGASTTNPISTQTAHSAFWNRTGMWYVDAASTAASAYRVTVSDEFSRVFSVSTASVAPTSPAATYTAAVTKDAPSSWWRFADGTSTTAADSSGKGSTATYTGGVLVGQRGVLTPTDTTAIRLDGVDDRVTANASTFDPAAYTLEAWVKTSSRAGGRLVGLSSSRTATSSTYDRHVYYTDDGRVVFGVSHLGRRVVTSPAAYNDGAWHHVVATQDSSGLRLYVDGAEVASDPTVTDAMGYTGFWKIGPDNLTGWPARPTSAGLAADVDEFAVYPVALTPQQIAVHAARGVAAAG